MAAVRRPLIRYRRRRHTDLEPLARQMLEAVGYRRSMFDFMAAKHRNPAILVEAELDEHSIVIDAGAFVGEWGAEVSERYGSSIVAFEPAPMYFAEMRKRLGSPPRMTFLPVGLGRRDDRSALTLEGPGSKVISGPQEKGTVDVEIRDVAAVFDELEIERVDLLKLNIEGGEYDVLERLAETDWLERIDDLLIQFHDWAPAAPHRRRLIRRTLAQTHTEVWNYPWVWERWVRRSS